MYIFSILPDAKVPKASAYSLERLIGVASGSSSAPDRSENPVCPLMHRGVECEYSKQIQVNDNDLPM